MRPEATGYLCLVLHAHLPFIRHPEHPRFLEEDWLFEAITETYAPLLETFERLRDDAIPFRLTMSLTPPLAAMLTDELLCSRYRAHLDRLLDLVARECRHNATTTVLGRLARHYRDRFRAMRGFIFDRCGGDLLSSIRSLVDSGHLEVITCTATHGFLPLITEEGARRAQIEIGVEAHRQLLGEHPQGIWLAECGYIEGIEKLVAEAGPSYFFVDSHAILFGDPRPHYGLHAPVTVGGACAFARDVDSSRQVWSTDGGYPGDFDYREFYRDLGFDADIDYIRPYLHPDGIRRNLGIKYHRITGRVPLSDKDFYDPERARQRAEVHAGNFMFNRQHQAQSLRARMDRPPIIVAPYDAELFGHWWYEGPIFLEQLIRKIHREQNEITLVTPSDYLERHPENQRQTPNASSWGADGHSRVWLNGSNAWMYRHQHHAERRMCDLARRHGRARGITARALNQAARELLLAQSSDWAFISTTGSTVPYATRRFKEHVQNFLALTGRIADGGIDEHQLSDLESRTPIFPWLDFRVFG